MAAELILPGSRAPRTHHKVAVFRDETPRSFRRTAKIAFVVAATILFAAGTMAAVLTYNSYQHFALMIDQQIAGGYLRGHAGLYAAPRIIEKGARLSQHQLESSLLRGGYARNSASNIWSGSFQENDNRIRILPRQSTETHEWIDVAFDNHGQIASLTANDGELVSYALEPELLTVDASFKTGQQQTLTYPDIPPSMVQAILAIEDRRFFDHHGVDLRGISRAFVSWVTSGSIRFHQGGSTITQQLVKNAYLTPEKTLQRKFSEAMIALALEQRLSKQDIFALYCNEVYLGQRNGVGVRGVAQAAKVYFGKELKDISLQEAATIAGMIQSPARYAPDRHPEAARERRDVVIMAMVRDGVLDLDEAKRETESPVNVAAFESSTNELAPYYLDAVNRAIEDKQPVSDTEGELGVRVQTTIDPDLQTAAEDSLRHQLDLLTRSTRGKASPQGALVALDVHTGQVLAMVGGRSYAESQLNRATDAKRQPGSVFKPFVYATALEAGISPLSIYSDAPQTFQYGTSTYSPANYGRAYSMHDVMLRDGLVRSLNVVTVDLALRTGLSRIATKATQFGLPRPEAYPSMALGVSEATPLQMAAAYAAFANGGTMIEPTVVAGTIDNNSEQLYGSTAAGQQVVRPTTAYMITDMLSDVIRRGTARRANGIFNNVAIAGKTGTSRDGWFVGYTPNLVCAVWIGFDDNQQLGMTGAEAALPAWIDFMKEAIAIRPSLGGSAFSKPAGMVTVKIDPESGELAGPSCPSSQTISVASQFAPMAECFKHLPKIDYGTETSEDLESSIDVSESSAVSSSIESPQTDQLTDKGSENASGTDIRIEDEPAVRVDLKSNNRQFTQTELNDNRKPRLVMSPTLVSDNPKVTKARP